MIKLILIILCFVVISGGFVCFCIVKASTPYYRSNKVFELQYTHNTMRCMPELHRYLSIQIW